MYSAVFVIGIYLSFTIDFLIIPIPSEASTRSLMASNRPTIQKQLLLAFIFTANLMLYLYPLLASSYHLIMGLETKSTTLIFYAGALLALLGRICSLVGSIVLRQQIGEVVSSSIFKWSRNPIALGMHLTFLGLIAVTAQWFLLLGLAFSVWNIHLKIKIEEQFLMKKFGIRYTYYMKKTPRYLWI